MKHLIRRGLGVALAVVMATGLLSSCGSDYDPVKDIMGYKGSTVLFTVNGQDGPKEVSVSAGFGFPIVNAYNNRSYLNISGQWVRSTAPGYIKENIFRINIGLTFNERWFAKWKVD